MKEGNIVDKFKDTIYSDNLHNYDYDELVENYIEQDRRKAKEKYSVSISSSTESLPEHTQFQNQE